MKLDGVLFFPVTPFGADGAVDVEVLKEHIASRLAHRPGGVFPACGTGEFHALSIDEVRTVVTAAGNPKVIGFKEGIGDVGLAQEIVSAVRASGREDFLLFNGLLTAELTQGAYRGLGIPLYSSAAFAVAPEIATAYYDAYASGDEDRRQALLDGFYAPLVRLRDQTPGFGVSLIKAGLRLNGLAVGPVRPPLVDPTEDQLVELKAILAKGHELAGR
jgi:5-dehydro-4-deoxyglucarate dehydratase